MEEDVRALEEGICNAKNDTEIVPVLLQFQKAILPAKCMIPPRDVLQQLFVRVWEILLKCSSSETTAVRISTYSAASAFLVKLTPYFPRYMIRAFSNMASKDCLDDNHGVILVSAFAFLTNFLDPVQLEDFLQKTPIFHHFIASDSLDSEYLSHIITNLSDLGKVWFQSLLGALLRQYRVTPSRSVMKAICSVIGRDPLVMMDYIMSVNLTDLSLISFIITSLGPKIADADIYPFAHLAMELLRSHNDSTPAMDTENSFRILAAKCNSFDVKVDVREGEQIELVLVKKSVQQGVNENRNGYSLERIYEMFDEEEKNSAVDHFQVFDMYEPLEGESDDPDEVDSEKGSEHNMSLSGSSMMSMSSWAKDDPSVLLNEANEEEEKEEQRVPEMLPQTETLILDLAKFKRTASFYLLPLPMKTYLNPEEDDSIAVISAKMMNIAGQIHDANEVIDVEQQISILDKFCGYEYNSTVSACLQCLSVCINSLIVNTKSNILPQILRRVLFTKIISWFHASDILRVVQEIRVDFIPCLFGPGGFRELVQLVLGFCVNQNEQLRNESRKTLINMAREETIDQLINLVIDDIDFYSYLSLQAHLDLLTELVDKFSGRRFEKMEFLAHAIMEIVDFYSDDIYMISSILEFMSKMDISSLGDVKSLINTAVPIAKAGLCFLSGSELPSDLREPYDMINRFVTSNSVEIISEGAHKYKERYRCIYASVVFLLALPKQIADVELNTRICEKMFQFFPNEITAYMYVKQKRTKKEKRMKMIHRFTKKFCFVKLSSVHAKWCDMFVRYKKEYSTKKFDAAHESLTNIAMWYMDNPSKAPVSQLVQFAQYLISRNREHCRDVLRMIYNMIDEHQQEFFDIGSHRFARFKKWFHSIRKESFWDQFSRIRPRHKLDVINDICNLPAPTTVSETIMKYGNAVLYGWKLLQFKRNTEQDTGEIEYRPFNMYFDDERPKEARIRALIETGNNGDLKSLLKTCDDFDCSGLRVSLEAARDFFDWLRSKSKIGVIKELTKNLHTEDLNTRVRPIVLEAMKADPARFLIEFTQSEKLSKAQITALAEGIDYFDDKDPLLLAMIVKQFEEVKSTKKMRVLLCLTEALMGRMSDIPVNFTKMFCDGIQAKGDLLVPEVVRVLAKMNARIPFDDEQQFLVVSLLKVLPTSVPYYINFGIPLNRFTTTQISDICTAAINSHIASNSLRWFVIIRYIADMNNERVAVKILHETLPLLFKEVKDNFLGNPVVVARFTSVVKAIFQNAKMKPLYVPTAELFIGHILSREYEPNFAPLFSILIDILPITPANSLVFKNICDVMATVIAAQSCTLEILRTYFVLFSARIRRVTDAKLRQEYVEGAVLDWIQRRPRFDSYYYSDYVDQWNSLMREFVSNDVLFTNLLFHFMKQPPRFFPFLVALIRATKFAMRVASPQEKESLKKHIADGCLLVPEENFSQSLLFVANQQYKEALDVCLK